ncbi:MAG TPA: copper amine oxidase N-terminal domain-containing protein [Alicyclobacillus sp.]|nr:copper amine oxidase N-terminal domain-containing protein [Alicyclobacillus sp.]
MSARAKFGIVWLAVLTVIVGVALWCGLSGRLVLASDSSSAPTHIATFRIGVGTYSINGYTKQDVAPYLSHDRTMLPLRYVAYAVGIGDNSIQWDEKNNMALLLKNTTLIAVPVGRPIVYEGHLPAPLDTLAGTANTFVRLDKKIPIDVPAEMKDDRVMLPLRTVAELFGCQVGWDNNTQTVTISY